MKKTILVIVLILSFVGLAFAQGEVISPETYASYYADAFHGKRTASGEIFDMHAYTAAHKTLPFGTLLEVTNLENGKKVIVRINDRGPFVGNREIDVSKAAAAALDMLSRGVTRVSLKRIDPNDRTSLGVPRQSIPAPKVPQYNPPTPVQPKPQYTPAPKYEAQQPAKVTPQYAPPAKQEYPAKPKSPAVNQMNDEEMQRVQEFIRQKEREEQQKLLEEYNKRMAAKQAKPQQAPPTVVYRTTSTSSKNLVYIPTTAAQTPGPLWRIQLGSFTREENAMRLVVALRKINFEPAFEKTETHIRVVLYGIRPSELEKVKAVLEENDYNDYILRQESW